MMRLSGSTRRLDPPGERVGRWGGGRGVAPAIGTAAQRRGAWGHRLWRTTMTTVLAASFSLPPVWAAGGGALTDKVPVSGAPAPSPAFSLEAAVLRASRTDPGFQAAQFGAAAGREFEVLGKAALRPAVQSGGNIGRNRQNREIAQPRGSVEDTRHYDSSNLNVRLTQPLLSFDNYGRYQDGLARADAAEQTFRDEVQMFIARVVERYAGVLSARRLADVLAAEGDDLKRQRDVAAARLDRGDGTRLELAEVETAVQRWRVEAIGARSALQRALRALEASVGPLSEQERLSIVDKDSAPRLFMGQPEQWIRVAQASSPAVALARSEVDIAKAAVTRARSSYFPRIDAFASHTLNDSDTVNTVDQQFETSSLGLQFSMPLYLGGAGSANLRQAKAQLGQAESRLEVAMADLTLNVQEAFDLAHLAREQLVALGRAEEAATEALNAAKVAYKAGAEGLSEVLKAQRELRAVRRELIEARYDAVGSFVSLNSVAGLLDEHVVDRLSELFMTDSPVLPPALPLGADAPNQGPGGAPEKRGLSLSWQMQMAGDAGPVATSIGAP
jgi:outer membrane protein, protease secretion system